MSPSPPWWSLKHFFNSVAWMSIIINLMPLKRQTSTMEMDHLNMGFMVNLSFQGLICNNIRMPTPFGFVSQY